MQRIDFQSNNDLPLFGWICVFCTKIHQHYPALCTGIINTGGKAWENSLHIFGNILDFIINHGGSKEDGGRLDIYYLISSNHLLYNPTFLLQLWRCFQLLGGIERNKEIYDISKRCCWTVSLCSLSEIVLTTTKLRQTNFAMQGTTSVFFFWWIHIHKKAKATTHN